MRFGPLFLDFQFPVNAAEILCSVILLRCCIAAPGYENPYATKGAREEEWANDSSNDSGNDGDGRRMRLKNDTAVPRELDTERWIL